MPNRTITPTTYQVTYDQIGRFSAVPHQTVSVTSLDGLVQAISAYARQYTPGNGVRVYVEPDRNRGGITQYGRPLGSFELRVVDGDA